MLRFAAGRGCAAAAAAAAVRGRAVASVVRLPSIALMTTKAEPTTPPVQVNTADFTPELLTKIGENDAKLRASYDEMPASYPAHALAPGDGAALTHEDAFRKRLLYRSKQRGWLEVDLLLGSWAAKHLPGYTLDQLKAYERILNMETLDLYNHVLGVTPCPPHVDAGIMKSIVDYSASCPLGRADPTKYAQVKTTMSN